MRKFSTTPYQAKTIYRRRLRRDEYGRTIVAQAYCSMVGSGYVMTQVLFQTPITSCYPTEVVNLVGAAPALFGAE